MFSLQSLTFSFKSIYSLVCMKGHNEAAWKKMAVDLFRFL